MNRLFSLLIFTGLLLVVFSVYLSFKAKGEKRRIVEKIEKEASGTPSAPPADHRPAGAAKKAFDDLTTRSEYSAPKGKRIPIEEEVIVAGYRKPNAPIDFYGSRSSWPSRCRPQFSLCSRLCIPVRKMDLLMLLLTLAPAGFDAPDLWVRLGDRQATGKDYGPVPRRAGHDGGLSRGGDGPGPGDQEGRRRHKATYRIISE